MVLNNHSTRDRQIKLLPQTHSPGVDYSLFIMKTLMMMLERVEIQPGMTPAAFPTPIFLVLPLFRCFSVYAPPPLGFAMGLYLQAFLGQNSEFEIKTDGCGRSRRERARVARPTKLTAPPGLVWASGTPRWFQCSSSSYFRKIDPRKIPGPFEFAKVLES